MEEGRVVHLGVVNRLHLRLVEPLNTFAVLPETKLDFVVFRDDVGSQAVLLALVPEAFIASLIGPSVYSEPMLLVVLVLTPVHAAIVPDVYPHALHVVVEPLALILAPVQPRVDSDARDLVLTPVSRVHRSVVPLVTSDSVLATKSIISFIA